uniref:Uncharacterized protein n=1 Tax=Romanomermis culicivorax TaxID=13658 RepID=A0A915K1I3_ROMCU
MWAYKTIKKLLKDAELSDTGKDAAKKKALDLCLKYGFVTDLTSMVVVQQQSPIPIILLKAPVEAEQASQSGGGGSGAANFNFPAPVVGGMVANGKSSSAFAGGSFGFAGPIGPGSIQPQPTFGKGEDKASASSEASINGEIQKKGTEDSCDLQVITILDTEVDKSPNGRITSAMASNIVQRVVVDHPSSTTSKIVYPLSSTNSTVKRDLAAEISAQLGRSTSTKNYVVLFAPYGSLNEKLVGSSKNTTILVIVLEQYSNDRLSKLNNVAGDSKNVLVNPSLNDVLKKITC